MQNTLRIPFIPFAVLWFFAVAGVVLVSSSSVGMLMPEFETVKEETIFRSRLLHALVAFAAFAYLATVFLWVVRIRKAVKSIRPREDEGWRRLCSFFGSDPLLPNQMTEINKSAFSEIRSRLVGLFIFGFFLLSHFASACSLLSFLNLSESFEGASEDLKTIGVELIANYLILLLLIIVISPLLIHWLASWCKKHIDQKISNRKLFLLESEETDTEDFETAPNLTEPESQKQKSQLA